MDRLLIDPVKTDDQVLSRCYGISRLEYETTMPTKFMVGTDMGYVFSCNRKGKTPSEKMAVRVCVKEFLQKFHFDIAITNDNNYIKNVDEMSPGAGFYDYEKSFFPEEFSHYWRLDSSYMVRRLSRKFHYLDQKSTCNVNSRCLESNKVNHLLIAKMKHS